MSLQENSKKIQAALQSVDGDFTKLNATFSKEKGVFSATEIKRALLSSMKEAVMQMDSLRIGGNGQRPIDLTFEEFAKQKFGFGSTQSFYDALDLNIADHTISSLQSMPDMPEGYRWLVPEIIRASIRLGLRRNPIYPSLIAGEETVAQTNVIMPMINMSKAMPGKVGEAETIGTGALSFNQKTVQISKIGTGLKVSDEVTQYVSLNLLSIYLQDVGVQMGMGMDAMAVDVLINGDGSANSSAPVIGVNNTTDGLTYKDILKIWIRMGRIGRTPSALLAGENTAISILEMAEFKGANYNNKKQDINLRTPIPQNQDFFVHGTLPSAMLGFLDTKASLLKLNATGLMVESQRMAESQVTGTYVSQTTGFAKMFTDGFLLLNPAVAFSSAGFPAGMNIDAVEQASIQ